MGIGCARRAPLFPPCFAVRLCGRCNSTRLRHERATSNVDHADPINQGIQKMNWKTTTTGILTVLISAASIVKAFLTGGTIVDLPTHIAAITAGLGLVFAKDAANR